MLLVLLALVPALALLFYYYQRDRHPEPWGWVAAVFVFGALSCLAAFPLQHWAQSFFVHPPVSAGFLWLECLIVPGMIEECTKLAVVVAAVWWRSDFDEPVDALVYGTAAALGFTYGEDLRYYAVNGLDTSRIFSTAAHPWFSCFWAASLGWVRIAPRRTGLVLVTLGLVASVFVHALFDFFLLAAEAYADWTWLRYLAAPLLVALYLAMEKQLDALQRQRPTLH